MIINDKLMEVNMVGGNYGFPFKEQGEERTGQNKFMNLVQKTCGMMDMAFLKS